MYPGHHRSSQFLRAQYAGRQAVSAQDPGRLAGLPAARLNEHVAAGRQPLPRPGGDPALNFQPVYAAIEAGPWLMQPRLLRHGLDVR